MPLLKLWYDLRVRAIAMLILISILAVVQMATFPSLKKLSESEQLPSSVHNYRFLTDYRYYATVRWLEGADVLAIAAVILSLGGVLTERRTRTTLLTLSFPVSRPNWLLMQALLAFVMLLSFALISSVVFYLGGLVHKEYIGLVPAIAAACILTLVSFPWIGMTIWTSTFPPHDRLVPAMVVVSLMTLLNLVSMISPEVNSWMPKTLMNAVVYSSPGIAKPICAILISAALSLFLAVRRFERMDF